MFVRKPIIAASKNGQLTSSKMVVANSSPVGGGIPVSTAAYGSSAYNYYMSGLLPATPDLPDSTNLSYFFRDIYMYDNTAGSCVDIQSTFPFSDFELRGLDEKDIEVYNRAVERLNLRELFPQLSVSYLTDGFFAGSLVYDSRAKNFMDILIHDALQCGISPSPFNNIDPHIRVSTSGPTLRFLDSVSSFQKQYVNSMPQQFVDLLKEGSFVLDPLTTLFVGRRGLTDRAYMSYLQRILPMYLIEKVMFRGTLIEANRRQRAMTHIQAGDDVWTPTAEELMILVQQFQTAETDPLGGWISTRNAVQVQDLRPGGDFWKWTDMTDVMVAYKLRAMGVSEALLSGDASYASAESAYSTYLETVNAYRTHLTNMIFYRKLFPLIAVTNGMYKNKNEKVTDVIEFLFNTNNRSKLRVPELHWHKDLTAKAEDNMMDLLEKLQEHNIPIPQKTWLAAAGIDKDSLIRDAKEEKDIQKALADAMGIDPNKMGSSGAVGDDEGFGSGADEFDGDMGEGQGEKQEARLTTGSLMEGFGRRRRAILNREFPSEEMFTQTVTGKKKYVFHNPRGKATDHHHKIAKISARMESDPNYRESVRKKNSEILGTDRVKGFSR